MARGEPLCNPYLKQDWLEISGSLTNDFAYKNGLIPRFNISTIMPKTYQGRLDYDFCGINPTLYYSLYSLDPKFREKWLPSAMDPYKALGKLKEYQDSTKKVVKLHWAFIKGENDNPEDVRDIILECKNIGLLFEFNMVRYNPYNSEYGEEADEDSIRDIEWELQRHSINYQIVPRVGQDIFASCGQFITYNDL